MNTRMLIAVSVLVSLAYGCSSQVPAPELPEHPGAAWNRGGNKPLMDSEVLNREGYVYEVVPASPQPKEIARPKTEEERSQALARLRADGKNSSALKQSRANLDSLRRQMTDMLKEKPEPLPDDAAKP
ncbi:MAG: hypothetical protein J6I40_07000 [Mailhella sp.]|nr:hypothetical protein [Mailhella sp.]